MSDPGASRGKLQPDSAGKNVLDPVTPSATENMLSWRFVLVFGLVATGGYFLIRGAGMKNAFLTVITLLPVISILIGVRRYRPERSYAWYLIAVGLSLWMIGSLIWTLYSVIGQGEIPFPSLADPVYLAYYPFLSAGLLLLVRAQAQSDARSSLIDAAIITIAFGLASWVFLMAPHLDDPSLTLLQRAVSLAYPLMDVLLLAVVVRLLLSHQARVPAFFFVSLALVTSLTTDAVLAVTWLTHTYYTGHSLTAGWMIAYTCWSAAALHPSMSTLTQPVPRQPERLTRCRLGLLAVAVLFAPALLALESFRGHTEHQPPIVAGSSLLVVLVLLRMAGIVRRHERAVQRELTLRQAGEALVAVVDRQGVYQAALDAACSLVPDSARTWIAIMEGGSAPMTIVEARGAEGIAVPPPDLSEEISVLAAGQPVEIQKYAGQLDPQRGNMLEWVFVIPLLVQQSLQGAIVVAAAQALPEEAQDGFRALASQLSLALERAVLEEERRRSEARFRSLVQNAADITALIDHSGTIRFVSPSVERILGYDPDAFVGVYIAAVIHPDDRARVGQFLVAILDERGATPTMEARLRHQDGSWRDVEWIGNNLLDDPNVGGIVVNVRDITDRKRAEERVRLLASIVESSDDAIVSKMLDGRIVSWNAGAERLYGYTAAEIIGHSFAMLVPPERSADVQWILDRITRGERIEQWETERQRKDGTRVFIALTDSPIRDGRGHIVGLSSIGRDITERKKVDRLKNEFISTVSHELRTPLTSIRGSLGLVVGGVAGELPPQAKTMVEIAYTNSERLVRLINDILDIEKIESGNMVFSFKVLDLMTIVDQAVKANGGFAEQFGVTFEITAAAPGVRVMADGDRLMQVLTNLLSNAAKFSPPNASVDIAIHRLPHGVRVQVHDRGPGIPDEFRGRIFQKFAQADASTTRKKGGTGLGLSIVKAIVEKHGGHVGFEMPPDGGTIFYVDLQEWSEPMPQLAQVEEASRPWVLICEDDSDVATLLRIILEQGGFSCDVAYGAIQAKALLAERQYTAMTLDIRLPDQDGISLIRELRNAEETRCLPIVVVSVVAQPPEEALNGAAVGLIDWLCKPIDPERLVAAVRQTVRQGSTEASRILHVEDDKDVREVVRMLLQTVGTVVGAGTLAEARQKLSTDSFDLILLDVELPDGSGLDLLPPPASDRQVSIPVLIFSAQEVNGAVTERVAAALVKTRTSNQQLLATIAALIGNGHGLSM